MYYYVDKKSEIIQTYNLRYRKNIKPQENPLGKILSELINFDYDRLFEYYNSLDYKEKWKLTNIKINGVCKETENVLQQLLLPVFYIRKNSNFISI
ncbi:MAG: hypothetical protein LUG21_05055, partial [Clostridiales bacterium]|nr:hypothetical protein [Clostridiales bacterium]